MSTPVVVDASAAASWLIRGQATQASDAFVAQSAGRFFIAPSCFRGEIRGVIVKLERRSALAPHSVDADLTLLEGQMEIEHERDVKTHVYWAAVMAIARREHLSVFDAAYLELAQRTSAEIASRDGGLIEAARRSGIGVYDLR